MLGMERFYLKKLKDVAVKEQYQVKISHRLTASENLMMMMMMWTSKAIVEVLESIRKP
jgi:hypothetical protein